MLLDILKYPDPFLKTRASDVEVIDDGLKRLVADMIETMYHARGRGLAATQVGVSRRIAVLDVPDDDVDGEEARQRRGKNLMTIINPVILGTEGSIVFEEGCLSVPGVTADVSRAEKVAVRALDVEGKEIEIRAQGLLAIALQHEIDHLDGTLFIDRLSRLRRDLIKRRLRKAMEAEEHAL